MSKTVGIREAKARFSHYIDLARSGDDVVITDRGKPIVRLVPIAPIREKGTVEDVLLELERIGLLEPGSAKKKPKKRPLPKLAKLEGKGPSISELVHEMRR